MSSVTSYERPGVYSSYSASAVVSGSATGSVVGLVAICETDADKEVQMIYSSDAAATAFGESSDMYRAIGILLSNGASAVAACPLADEDEYEDAFAVLTATEGIDIVMCDSDDSDVHALLKTAVEEASSLQKERIAVVCPTVGETSAQLVARAKALNSERVVLLAPLSGGEAVVDMTAAVCGAIAGETDPAVPMGGAVLSGLDVGVSAYGNSELDALILGGVTVLERSGSEVSIVRAVTTRTTTNSVADSTYRELTTIRIIDDVIPSVRDSLKLKFTRTKNTEQVRSAIRSQVIMDLETKLTAEMITEYGDVTAAAVEDNPTVCLVEFSFCVTHGLNQIWLSANITV